MVAIDRWKAIGTWCEILTLDPDELPEAAELARARVASLDLACSRFRQDSELRNLKTGRTQAVGPVLGEAIAAALRTAEFTGGLVDPTVGAALRVQGYDADLDEVRSRVVAATPGLAAVPGVAGVELDDDHRHVRLDEGIELDLGASAKAWAADWIADACLEELGISCLVNLGGDIAARGEYPDGGWQIEVDDGPSPNGRHPVIAMGWGGGVATSSTALRTWPTTAGTAHHVIDPATGRPALRHWKTVTVAARSCERANAASTAAIILGDAAPRWLTQRELPARLVHSPDMIIQTNGWPSQRWVA